MGGAVGNAPKNVVANKLIFDNSVRKNAKADVSADR
jgi:hypothetical protein